MHLRLRYSALHFYYVVLVYVVLAATLVPLAAAQSDAALDAALERVLTQMDSAAKDFRSLDASFVWDQYTKVVQDTDTSKGTIYFRREGKEINMAADITEPAPKVVLFADGLVQMYEPRIDQVTPYKTGKHRAEVESFLILGFGGRGHDLAKSYDVKHLGTESLDGVETAKLELIPKSDKARNQFSRILLWIDPARGISVQQQVFQPSGDYRLAKYSKIHINQKLPDGVFKLKTTNKTTYLSPQG
jgi:outer membrane lipoprotein-sorting protein